MLATRLLRLAAPLLSAAALMLVTAGPTLAQGTLNTKQPWGCFSTRPLTEAPEGVSPLTVRANASQPIYLNIFNPVQETREVDVAVTSNGAAVASGASLLPEEKKVTLKPRQGDRPSVTAVALKAAPPGPNPNPLGLPIDKLLFEITVDNNRARQVIEIVDPERIVNATAVFVGASRRLSVFVELAEGVAVTGDIPVALEISRDLIPGLRPGEFTRKVLEDKLSPQRRRVELFAEGMTVTGVGEVGVTVDNVRRAKLLRGNFTVPPGQNSSAFARVEARGLWIDAPAAVPSGPPVTVHLLASNLPQDMPVKLEFGRDNTLIAPERTFPGPRRAEAFVKEAPKDPKDHLLLTTVLKDWEANLSTEGKHLTAVLVASAEGIRTEKTLVIDSSKPADVQLVKPAKEPIVGKPLTLRAVGKDPETGIARVDFFLNDPPPAMTPDGKYPPATKSLPGRLMEDTRTKERFWQAVGPIMEKPGSVNVYVRFVNNVGLHDDATEQLTVVPAPPPVGGRITVQVLDSGVIQKKTAAGGAPGVSIYLYDPNAATPAKRLTFVSTATPDEKGNYVFDDLKPGDYIMATRKDISGSPKKAQSPVITVKVGDKIEAKPLSLMQ